MARFKQQIQAWPQMKTYHVGAEEMVCHLADDYGYELEQRHYHQKNPNPYAADRTHFQPG